MSILSTLRTNQLPNRDVRAIGAITSRMKATASAWPSSTTRTLSRRRPKLMVAMPAARRLRAQSVSPNGDMKPRRPPYSQIVTGVVRGKPVFLPRTVMSTSGPIGTPSLSRGLARRLKKGTQDGICRASIGRSRGSGMVILMIVFEVMAAGGGDC